LLLAAGAAAFWYWDAYLRVKVEYYAHTISRWGVAEGVGRLTEQEAAHRLASYKLYVRGGLVERVDAVNGLGEWTGWHTAQSILRPRGPTAPWQEEWQGQKECSFRYRRDAEGNLTEETACNRAGRTVWTLHYTAPDMAHYIDRHGVPRPRTYEVWVNGQRRYTGLWSSVTGGVYIYPGDTANNITNVEDSVAGVTVTITLGSGTDLVSLSPSANTLDNIQGAVIVQGGTGSATLAVYDQA
jgi:hypothetical protein